MWESILDWWSIIHIILFFALGIIVFLYSKKPIVGFSIGMLVAVIWEIFERFYLVEHVGFPIFYQTPLNSLTDLLFYDVIGLVLAYIYIKQVMKKV